MAEYSRILTGQVTSTGGNTPVVLPVIPDFIEISNATRAVAASGVTRAWWMTDMGQGSAFAVTTGASDVTSFVSTTTGTGFSTFQAGIALQYGPVYQHTGSTDFSISKANPAVVTTTTNHGLVSGNVVIFSNLYQTSTTGMPQISNMPFVVTSTGATTFTIPWNTNQSNYTAFNTSTSTNNVGSWKQVLYPSLYVPGVSFISAITTGVTTSVTTTSPHNFQLNQEVAFRIPSSWGTTQLNSLPNVLIPGSPTYGFVSAVTSNTFTVTINSSGYTAFNSNQTVASVPGLRLPQVLAVGDANSGSLLGNFLSPSFYNGSSTGTVNTINGPAIAGAYVNATSQGFIIGSAVAGTASDVILWRAHMSDLNS